MTFAFLAAPPSPENLDAFAQAIVAALSSGNYVALVCLGVIGAVALLRKFGGARFPILRTDRGGLALALLASVAGALFTLPAGTPLLGTAALAAIVKVLLGSVGSYTAAKKLASAQTAGDVAAARVSTKADALAEL